MKGTRAAIRYAKSILHLAVEQKNADKVNDDMTLVANTISDNKDLALMLKSPIVKADKKQAVLSQIFDAHITPISSSFLKLIVSNGRESILHPIASSFLAQYKSHNNIASAEVITAIPMPAELKKKVHAMIKDSEKREVELTETVNADIIGGLIVRIGDKQIDASIARKINDLKQTFNTNPQVAEI